VFSDDWEMPIPNQHWQEMDVDLDSDSEYDSQDELPVGHYAWKEQYSLPDDLTGDFCQATGPNLFSDDNFMRPSAVFNMVFPDQIFSEIVEETNRYIEEKRPGSKATTIEEMKAFLGLNLIMGLKKYPSYRDPWSSSKIFHDSFISSVMTVHRFGFLLSHIHFNNNANQAKPGDENYDKLFKIRPILDHLNRTFAEAYEPTRNQSIDESMIKFKGRSYLKQYMPKKPIKRGYKAWVRADETGYVCQFSIYTGKNGDKPTKNLGSTVVNELTADLAGKNYNFYFDSFFSSVELMSHLRRHGKNAAATIRRDRKLLPKMPQDKSMKEGDTFQRIRTDGISISKWMDKRPVHMISNMHNINEFSEKSCTKKDGSLDTKKLPTVVCDYNKHMGYVDLADQLKSYYEIDRKSKRWYLRIFWHLLNVAVVNAFLIHQATHQVTTLKIFTASLAEVLIGTSYLNRKRLTNSPATSKSYVPEEKREEGQHFPKYGTTSRRCGACSTKADPHRTKWLCTGCQIPLCLSDKRNCFLMFHKKK